MFTAFKETLRLEQTNKKKEEEQAKDQNEKYAESVDELNGAEKDIEKQDLAAES